MTLLPALEEVDSSVRTRAELRRYASAYFNMSGYLAGLAVGLQVVGLALASLPSFRNWLEPSTRWVILALAGVAPLLRSFADDTKRTADEILRRLEASDGLGVPIRAMELENVRQGAFTAITWIAEKQALDPTPYASRSVPGPRRLVENARETAWWSTRLAREQARWEFVWTAVMGLACVVALIQVGSTAASGHASNGAHDLVEFASAMLVFVFAEGFFRRALELSSFAKESQRTVEKADRLLRPEGTSAAEAISVPEALLLASGYAIARNAAPRLSSIWYRQRRNQLNAAWDRICAEDATA